MSVKITQHVPSFVDTGEPPQEWIAETAADLDLIPWISAWKLDPRHRFDHYAGGANGRLLMVIYDQGSYWWVLGYLSSPLPGLPSWEGPKVKGS